VRHALVAQLESVDPPLNDSDITRERLALEEAIRKVEAEASRKSRPEPARAETTTKVRAPDATRWEAASKWDEPVPAPAPEEPLARKATPAWPEPTPLGPLVTKPEVPVEGSEPSPATASETQVASPPAQRMPITDGPSLLDSGLRDFRGVISEADGLGDASARAVKSARDRFDSVPDPAEGGRAGKRASATLTPDMIAPSFLTASPTFRLDGKGAASDEPESEFEDAPRAPPRSYRELIRIASALMVVLCVGGLVAWQWPAITLLYRWAKTPTGRAA